MGFNENQISALGPGREDGWSQHLADGGWRLLSGVHHHKECDVETVLLGSLEGSEGEGGGGVQTGFTTERWRQIRSILVAVRLEAPVTFITSR